MITENNVVPLFGIPLCQTQIKPYEENEKFIKEKLDYELRSHKVSYISKDDYVLDRDNLLPLKTEILQKVGEFMHGYLDVHEKHKFVLTTSWCNKYEQNQYIQEHYHSNSLISGVLFLTDCKDTSNIVFHKDKNHTNIFTDTSGEINYATTISVLLSFDLVRTLPINGYKLIFDYIHLLEQEQFDEK